MYQQSWLLQENKESKTKLWWKRRKIELSICVTPLAQFLVCLLYGLFKIQCLNLSASWRQKTTRKQEIHGTLWRGNILLFLFCSVQNDFQIPRFQCLGKMDWWCMVIMTWLAPETRDPFKEILRLPVRSSTVLGDDSQQRTQKHYSW